MNVQWDQIQEIFRGCLEYAPTDRDRFLCETCGDDEALRHRVEVLLENDGQNATNGFLDWPAQTSSAVCRLAEPGDSVGDYRIDKLAGSGSSGEVYRAVRENDDLVVAVKLLRPWQSDETALARFQREAEALRKLSHPNIARMIEMVKPDSGQPFIVMQFIDGKPLNRICEANRTFDQNPGSDRRPPNIQTRIDWFLAICNAVAAAHEAQILHRDLKPSNIMIDDVGDAIVTDFGLARFFGTESQQTHLTTTGRSLGTPRFMAPEQFNSDDSLGMTTDVYGLGAVLYYMLTGNAPFESENIFEIAGAVRAKQPIHPRVIDKKLDQDLATICLHCLRKKPVDRYQTVSELIADIENWRSGKPISVRTPSTWQRLTYWARRNPAIATLCGLLLFTVVAGLVGTTHNLRVANQHHDKLQRQKQQILDAVESVSQIEGDLAGHPAVMQLRADTLRTLIGMYEDLLIDNPGNEQLTKRLAVHHRQLGILQFQMVDRSAGDQSQEAALILFSQLATQNPEKLEYQFDVFHCLRLLREYEQALELITSIVERDGRENNYYLDALSDMHLQRAKELFSQRLYEQSVDAANIAEQITVESLNNAPEERSFFEWKRVAILLYRFRALVMVGEIDEGVEDLNLAVDLAHKVYVSSHDSTDRLPELPGEYVSILSWHAGIHLIDKNYDLSEESLQDAENALVNLRKRQPEHRNTWTKQMNILRLRSMLEFEQGILDRIESQIDETTAQLQEIVKRCEDSAIEDYDIIRHLAAHHIDSVINARFDPARALEMIDDNGDMSLFLRARAHLLNGDAAAANRTINAVKGGFWANKKAPYLKIVESLHSGKSVDMCLKDLQSRIMQMQMLVSTRYHQWFVFRHFDKELEAILKANGIEIENN